MNLSFDTRIILLIYSLLQGLAGLRLVKVSIPAYKLRGESTFLECQYELSRPNGSNMLNGNLRHSGSSSSSGSNNNDGGRGNSGDTYIDMDSDDGLYRRIRTHQYRRIYHQQQQQQQQQSQYSLQPQQYQTQASSSSYRIYDEPSRLRDHHNSFSGISSSSSISTSNNNGGGIEIDSTEHSDEGEALYAVKWYKDNEEFYRFVPKSDPQKQSFPVDGIRVIDEHSDSRRVLLRGLTLNSTGLYRCEVSAEAPNFSSVQGEGRMDIVYLPRDGPHIKGQQFQYQIGDTLNLNCTSGKSHPASHLQWFINDEPLIHSSSLVRYNDTVHRHGLITSTLGLQLTVDGRHFHDGAMRVKCLASISPVLWKGGKESVLQRRPGVIDNREAMLLVLSSATQTKSSLALVAIILVLLYRFGQLILR
ncbi:uncharacterized protein LOC129913084 [Episyrphus balteatus]|uniref:uncharacterized protein LOC129913084 n=1 Tax=Episyrphus balteatus TaxID=286459 RepID=UPI002485E562|nr:uncharacterized protein LOC129913084 [Episyrphus balteatus]XP_055847507.1 uncharacterized protein LOC129913084 [Episyrphus balteatus]